MKKKTSVKWDNPIDTRIGIGRLVADVAWEAVAILFLVASFITIIRSVCGPGIFSRQQLKPVILVCVCSVFYQEFLTAYVMESVKKKSFRLLTLMLSKLSYLAVCLYGFGKYCFGEPSLANVKKILGGLLSVEYDFVQIYNKSYNTFFEVRGAIAVYAPTGVLFLVLLAFCAIYLVSFPRRNKWGMLLLPFTIAGIDMYVGHAPSWLGIFLLTCGIYMLYDGKEICKIGVKRLGRLGIFVCILFLSGMIFSRSADKLLTRSQEAIDFEVKLEQKVQEKVDKFLARLGRGDDGKVVNANPGLSDETIMLVRLDREPTGNLYFKTFYGVDYENGQWSRDDSAFDRFCEEYGYNKAYAARKLMDGLYIPYDVENGEISVKYNNPFERRMMLPYSADVQGLAIDDFQGDSLTRKALFEGEEDFKGRLSNNYLSWYVTSGFVAKWKNFSGEDKKFWNAYNNYVRKTYMNAADVPFYESPYDVYKVARPLMNLPNLTYPNGDVSEDLVNSLENNIQEIATMEAVRCYLFALYRYSWDLDPIGSGTDPVSYFLRTGKRGYCMHFASANCLILRNFSVPARYVSGYMLKPSMFHKTSDGSYEAEVIGKYAHAWVEIYLDYVGWVPFEVTPGYDSQSTEIPAQEEAEKVKKKNQTPTPAPAGTPTPSPTPVPESTSPPQESESPTPAPSDVPNTPSPKNRDPTPSPKPGSEIKIPFGGDSGDAEPMTEEQRHFAGRVFAGILIVVLLILLTIAHIKEGNRLKNAIREKCYLLAVKIMNERVYDFVRVRSRRAPVTDKAYEERLIELLGPDMQPQIKEFMRIVKAATFSDGDITSQECAFVWRIYKQTRSGKPNNNR